MKRQYHRLHRIYVADTPADVAYLELWTVAPVGVSADADIVITLTFGKLKMWLRGIKGPCNCGECSD